MFPFPEGEDQEGAKSRWPILVLFLLTLAIGTLCAALFAPFLPAITWAIALTVATRKPYDWLRGRLKNKTLTAAVGVLLVVLLIVTPASLVFQSLGKRVVETASLVQSGTAQSWVHHFLDQYPRLQQLIDRASGAVSFEQAAQSTAGFLAARLRAFLAGSVTTLTQLIIMLFTLFFLFRDREEARLALRSLVPLNVAQIDLLLHRMGDTISAVLQGSLLIAVIRALLGGVMFWILGVPDALMWSVIMALVGTIPALGTFLVWMPVTVYLLATEHWIKATVLFGWGAFVIGTVDNLLYPTLVGSKLQLHTVPVFFAVLGGMGLFGITGIVLGPLLLTTFVTLLPIWKSDVAVSSALHAQPRGQAARTVSSHRAD